MSKIDLPNGSKLFIGDQWDSLKNFDCILNMTPVILPHKSMIYQQIPWEDTLSQNISKDLDIGFRFIDENLNKNLSVLVCCQAGRSRSGAMVIYYIMKKFNMNYKNALIYVQQYRNIVKPNKGFELDLINKML
jgi:protein-tyrosine phosphatase